MDQHGVHDGRWTMEHKDPERRGSTDDSRKVLASAQGCRPEEELHSGVTGGIGCSGYGDTSAWLRESRRRSVRAERVERARDVTRECQVKRKHAEGSIA